MKHNAAKIILKLDFIQRKSIIIHYKLRRFVGHLLI